MDGGKKSASSGPGLNFQINGPHELRRDALGLVGIALVNMLEEGGALLVVNLGRVGPGQAGIQGVLDDQLQLGASGGFLPPGRDKQLLQSCQQLAGDFLDLNPFLGAQFRCAICEGLFIGGLSSILEARFAGIVLQAVMLTFGTGDHPAYFEDQPTRLIHQSRTVFLKSWRIVGASPSKRFCLKRNIGRRYTRPSHENPTARHQRNRSLQTLVRMHANLRLMGPYQSRCRGH